MGRGYRRLRPNDRGWLWLETLGVWLGQENGRVVCYDGQGNPIGTVAEIDQARRIAQEQAATEAQARRAAEERMRQLEEELRKHRGGKRSV